MLSVEQIEDWLGQDVLDSAGERLGKLDEVFYSSRSGEAVFASVKSGLLGRHSDTVPLAEASVGRDYVRLAYGAEQIERAGSEVRGGDTLGREDARRLGELYGIELSAEDEFESASVINERREQAKQTRRQAEALEAEAHRRAADAQDAQSTAAQAGEQASEKAERAKQARADAERARAEAEQLPGA